MTKTDINDFMYIACASQNIAHRTKGVQRGCVNCSEEGLNGILNVLNERILPAHILAQEDGPRKRVHVPVTVV